MAWPWLVLEFAVIAWRPLLVAAVASGVLLWLRRRS